MLDDIRYPELPIAAARRLRPNLVKNDREGGMSQKSLCSRGYCEQHLRAAEMERAHQRGVGVESPTIVPAGCQQSCFACPTDATANSVGNAVFLAVMLPGATEELGQQQTSGAIRPCSTG